jgi:hypothetical protein
MGVFDSNSIAVLDFLPEVLLSFIAFLLALLLLLFYWEASNVGLG